MSETTASHRATEPARETRRRIFEAAARVFAAKGYHNATVSEIAQEAGLGKGTIYEYVKSKQQLLYLVIEEGHDNVLEAIDGMLALELTPDEKWRRVLHIMMAVLEEHRDAARALMPEIFGLELTDPQFVENVKNKYISRLQKVYDDGVRAGVFREMDGRMVSGLFLNLISLWCKSDAVCGRGGEPAQAFEKTLLDLFFNGITR